MTDEDDVSAEEEAEIESPWLPQQDEYKGRQEGSPGQKSQGKKSSFRVRKVRESFETTFETLFSRQDIYEIFREFKEDRGFLNRLSEGKVLR